MIQHTAYFPTKYTAGEVAVQIQGKFSLGVNYTALLLSLIIRSIVSYIFWCLGVRNY